MKRALWLADVLRAAGLTVVEHDGWQSRGRDFDDLTHVVWHHDGSPAGDSPGVPAYMLGNWERAAAQLWVDRRGVWHVLASGVAYHAGRVLKGKPGNRRSLGVETDHRPDEDWPPALLASLRTGTAAILRRMGREPEDGLEFHRTVCSPVGRKTDPDGLGLAAERHQVAVAGDRLDIRKAAPAAPTGQELDMDEATLKRIVGEVMDERIALVLRGDKTHPDNLRQVRADVAALKRAVAAKAS